MNGKITEVKQSALRLILGWMTIWDPNILSFFSLAMIGKNIKQIRQILLISLSFGKTQMPVSKVITQIQLNVFVLPPFWF